MGNAELDAHIIACCTANWRKVAMVVWLAVERANLEEKHWGYDAIAKRLRKLIKRRKLEAVGDIWRWRRSEVRLPQASKV